FACPVSGFSLSEIEPRIFSFNSPYGACPDCDGLGTEIVFDPDLIIPNHDRAVSAAIIPWSSGQARYQQQTLESLAAHYGFNLNRPYKDLSEQVKHALLYGSGEE